MGTRAEIGYLNKDGTIISSFCGINGVYEILGDELLKNFNSSSEAKKLSNRKFIHYVEDGKAKYMRGDPDKAEFEYDSVEEYIDIHKTSDRAYLYLFKPEEDKWYVMKPHEQTEFEELTQELVDKKE